MKNSEKKTKNLSDNEEITDIMSNYLEAAQLRQFISAIHKATIPFKKLIKTRAEN